MGQLADFRHLSIDWDMSPEEAVTMYLEWGNNWRRGERSPVRSKNEVSNYFVLSTWEQPPVVTLVQRSSDGATELATLDLPPELRDNARRHTGTIRGVFDITPALRSWLERELEPDTN
jgi:hypothetical protein